MTFVTITIHVLPAKRKELFQTLHELMQVMSQNPGYQNARLTVAADDPNLFTFVEAWENQQAVESYMESEHFSVLQGALKLLARSSEMTIISGAKQSLLKTNNDGERERLSKERPVVNGCRLPIQPGDTIQDERDAGFERY